MRESTPTATVVRQWRDVLDQRRAAALGYARITEEESIQMQEAANEAVGKTANWLVLPGGEVPDTSARDSDFGVPRIKNRLSDPTDNTRIAEDASLVRLELLGQMPLDCAPMALDAVNSIQAQNSLEKMLVHQAAVAHEMGMRFSAQALSCRVENSLDVARYAASATKCMAAYQAAMATLQRMRGEQQRITVQYVSVGPNELAAVRVGR